MARIIVAGAVNMDIAGTPAGRYLPGDSNPGTVTLSPGGVARNIAHDLRLLGQEVELITALGKDAFADAVRASCASLGIGLTHALTAPQGRTSVYLCINDAQGDLAGAVSDMDICALLTPEFFAEKRGVLADADAILVEANLSAAALEEIVLTSRVPVFADAVSAAKCLRLEGALPGLFALKPNRREALAMTGTETVEDAAAQLLARGVQRVFITLGPDGVYYSDARQHGYLPSRACEAVSFSGAGDAFSAALVWAWLEGSDTPGMARAGLAAAAAAARCTAAVNPLLSPALLWEESK